MGGSWGFTQALKVLFTQSTMFTSFCPVYPYALNRKATCRDCFLVFGIYLLIKIDKLNKGMGKQGCQQNLGLQTKFASNLRKLSFELFFLKIAYRLGPIFKNYKERKRKLN